MSEPEEVGTAETGLLPAALVELDNDLSAIIRSARDARLKVQQALGWTDEGNGP